MTIAPRSSNGRRRLAFDIANSGFKAIVDYMERGGETGRSASGRDARRVGELAARSLDQATRVARDEGTDNELSSIEQSLIDLADAAGPKLALAAARLVTRNAELAGLVPRDNTILVIRELGRVATSLLDESVGNIGQRTSDVGPRPDGRVCALVCKERSTDQVTVELYVHNESFGKAASAATSSIASSRRWSGNRMSSPGSQAELPPSFAGLATERATWARPSRAQRCVPGRRSISSTTRTCWRRPASR